MAKRKTTTKTPEATNSHASDLQSKANPENAFVTEETSSEIKGNPYLTRSSIEATLRKHGPIIIQSRYSYAPDLDLDQLIEKVVRDLTATQHAVNDVERAVTQRELSDSAEADALRKEFSERVVCSELSRLIRSELGIYPERRIEPTADTPPSKPSFWATLIAKLKGRG
ncbi:hypothetical protein [Microvirga pudoricolor]|uniref:hypothetical protein n=1 Tax=Microvirga pudoricolor TaxID=2778729 RepID=UPI00194DD559|nr:hypothetical protein [Microvirga pudoricolor]MBM6595569.1 hypothetical protein [Microvirga pudoricolor]